MVFLQSPALKRFPSRALVRFAFSPVQFSEKMMRG
jgi:hypothetical protein